MGFLAIFATISPVIAPATESPTNTSAPTRASAIVRACRRRPSKLPSTHQMSAGALVHDAFAVAQQDVLARHAEPHVVLGGRDRRGARAGKDDAHLLDLFSDDLERVEQRGAGDDRRAVLVVVEDGIFIVFRSVSSM